jgi:hypothetical protein
VRVARETRAKFARLRRRYSKLEKGEAARLPLFFSNSEFLLFCGAEFLFSATLIFWPFGGGGGDGACRSWSGACDDGGPVKTRGLASGLAPGRWQPAGRLQLLEGAAAPRKEEQAKLQERKGK